MLISKDLIASKQEISKAKLITTGDMFAKLDKEALDKNTQLRKQTGLLEEKIIYLKKQSALLEARHWYAYLPSDIH